MNIKRWICLLLAIAVTVSFSSFSPLPSAQEVAPVAVSQPDAAKVLEARFLNMLNHNFAYDDAFASENGLIDSAVIALLDYEEYSFLPETVVRDYLLNMYGVEVEDFSFYKDERFPSRDGYVYIIPRGFTVYTHVIDSIRQNEDGTYTVNTTVSVSEHDGDPEVLHAVSVFVPNQQSVFGYQLLSCRLFDSISAV